MNPGLEDTKLGAILIDTGIVSEEDLERCLEVQRLTAGRWQLGEILVEQGVLNRTMLRELLVVQQALRSAGESAPQAQVTCDDGDLLGTAVAVRASDLFLSEGNLPFARTAGGMIPLGVEPLAGPELWQFVREHMGMDALEQVAEHQSVTAALGPRAPARGRVTAFRQFDGLAISVRLHRAEVRTPEEAGIDQRVVDAVRDGRGLVLVASEGGAGLTETFATLLQVAAAAPGRSVHVLDETFEYPVPEGGAIVTCRRVGEHTKSWASGVQVAIREEPDVLFVAEADAECVDHLVHAADSGALVVAGVRAATTTEALARLRARSDEPRVLGSLAAALLAVLAVRTVPKQQRDGFVLASELLLLDDTVRDLVRNGALDRIRALLRVDASNHDLDGSLMRLVTEERVRFEDAFALARDKSWMLDARRTASEGVV